MKLSDTNIRSAKVQPGKKLLKLFDGEGLFLFVTPNSKIWRLAYRFNGKQNTATLGPYPRVSLKEARRRRDEIKNLLDEGIDPNTHKKDQKKAAEEAEVEASNTFERIALEWHTSHAPSLTDKHALKLLRYLKNNLFPVIGKTSVNELTPSHFLEVIRPFETAGKVDTAHRIAGLSSQVMEYARIIGYVTHNPAAGLRRVIRPNRHESHAAILEPKEIGQLLRDIDAVHAHPSIHYYLKILPYVFTRPTELRVAEWAEVDFESAIWRIPASRVKTRQEHVVPLATQVLSLLKELREFSGAGRYLFPSIRAKTATLSDAGPLATLRRMGYTPDQMSIHGFRAMASTNLNELGYRPDVIETQLAHKEPDAVRMAYNRAEYMEERRKMMQEWAEYLDKLKVMEKNNVFTV